MYTYISKHNKKKIILQLNCLVSSKYFKERKFLLMTYILREKSYWIIYCLRTFKNFIRKF